MAELLFQSAAYLCVPLLALALERRHRLFEIVNPVVFSYLAGMAMANVAAISVDASTAKIFTNVSIPLAIPLVLFPSDFEAWLRQSRATVVSFCCAIVAVSLASVAAAWLFWGLTDEFWRVSGMLVGVYTGGTPNLNSIGMAVGAREETFVLLNASDVVASAFYLLFLLTAAKAVVGWLLPAFSASDSPGSETSTVDDSSSTQTTRLAASSQMAIAFALSLALFAASAGLTYVAVGSFSVAGVFLGLTTGGIAGSWVDCIRNLEGSYELGNYLILVFCVAMGARTDFSELMDAGTGILWYTAFVIYAAVLLHLMLAALLQIDVDTFLITSTAAVFGPAFVPVIAEALDNRRVVLSGLTAGLVGYAIANYLGIGLAYLLRPG